VGATRLPCCAEPLRKPENHGSGSTILQGVVDATRSNPELNTN
jgi:hypothetical protein